METNSSYNKAPSKTRLTTQKTDDEKSKKTYRSRYHSLACYLLGVSWVVGHRTCLFAGNLDWA